VKSNRKTGADRVVVTVIDNGPGSQAKETIAKVFRAVLHHQGGRRGIGIGLSSWTTSSGILAHEFMVTNRPEGRCLFHHQSAGPLILSMAISMLHLALRFGGCCAV